MLCENCKLKKICKNYDYLTEHKEITISDCTYVQLENPYAFMNELSKPMEIKNEPQEPFKPKIIKTEEKNKIIKCPNCGVPTFENDIKECSKCHKKICSNCGTDVTNIAKDSEDVTITFLCNECNGSENESESAYKSSSSIQDLLNFDFNKEEDK